MAGDADIARQGQAIFERRRKGAEIAVVRVESAQGIRPENPHPIAAGDCEDPLLLLPTGLAGLGEADENRVAVLQPRRPRSSTTPATSLAATAISAASGVSGSAETEG